MYLYALSQLTDTVLVSSCSVILGALRNCITAYEDSVTEHIVGTTDLDCARPIPTNRILSVIHSLFIEAFSLGNTRTILTPLVSIRMLLHKLSSVSIVSVLIISQVRSVYADGLIVNAPTGHISATFPIISAL